ncbi:MAG TPA: hypothetical protein VNV88_14785 [Candidatus Solibacter sp.]|nr:hypothetical protein [Candidatus Solibacter sp.]
MAICYRIDPSRAMIFTTFADTVTDSDFQDFMDALAQDPAFNPNFAHLVDWSQTASFKISTAVIAAVARKQLFSPHAKRAIVAPNDYIFGMARMFQMQQDGSLEVFRSLAEAQEWLGISEKIVPEPLNHNHARARSA